MSTQGVPTFDYNHGGFSCLSSGRRRMDICKIHWRFGLEDCSPFNFRSSVALRLYHEFSDETGWRFRGHISQVRWVKYMSMLNGVKLSKGLLSSRHDMPGTTQWKIWGIIGPPNKLLRKNNAAAGYRLLYYYAVAKWPAAGQGFKITKWPAVRYFFQI